MGEKEGESEKREKREKGDPKKKKSPKLWLLLNLDYSLETYPMVK